MDEIFPDLYRIKIPLPENPLGFLNSYVIKGNDRNLIIDTGFNREECYAAMKENLNALQIELNNTDFFITHLHGDHFGLVPRLITDTGRMFFNPVESQILKSFQSFDHLIAYLIGNGFPEDKVPPFFFQRPSHQLVDGFISKIRIKKEGDIINAARYHFTCVETPGHSLGHMCLYEPHKKILIAGDHILSDITPGVQCMADDENPLKQYLESLRKIQTFEIDLVLPGHQALFKEYGDRIETIIKHHERRLDEIFSIVQDGPINAYQIASKTSWDIDTHSWDDVPNFQKWFATAEVIAHLRYLEQEKKVQRRNEGKVTQYLPLTD